MDFFFQLSFEFFFWQISFEKKDFFFEYPLTRCVPLSVRVFPFSMVKGMFHNMYPIALKLRVPYSSI